MSDLSIIPVQDGFSTQLAQDWNGATGTVYVLDTPSYTPTNTPTYIVVNPGKTNMQIATINAYDSTAKTLTVSDVTLLKGIGINSTAPASSHATGNTVIISDNYQFWANIQTSVNSKLDITGANAVEYATTAVRDSALGADGVPTTPYTNIYVTATGLFYNYNLSTAQWEAIDTGTTPGNATTSSAGLVRSDVAPAGIPVALIQDNPKYDALAGTSGTPSTSNKYVTNDDTATAATADKVARRLAGGNITVVTESQANNSTNAASTAYVDAAITLINAGVITDLSTLTNGNNDTTVTLTFQPRLIELNYWLQGHDAATSLNIYLGSGGTAVYEGTTLKYNNTLVNNSRLSGENGGLDTTFSNASPNLFKNTNLTTAPFAGTDGANNSEKKVTLSVNSVSGTGFVIRLVTAGGDGASNRARAAISWKAFK